jgi:hypothetical protein
MGCWEGSRTMSTGSDASNSADPDWESDGVEGGSVGPHGSDPSDSSTEGMQLISSSVPQELMRSLE